MKHPDVKDNESVVVECDLAEPPEKVWRALTTPAVLAEWLMPNEIRPEVGARFSLRTAPANDESAGNAQPTGKPARHEHGLEHAAGIECEVHEASSKSSSVRNAEPTRTIECEVLEAQPPRLLQYRWREEPDAAHRDGRVLESVVTFTLANTPSGGTHLRVVHDDFQLVEMQPTAVLASVLPKRSTLARRRARTARHRRPITAMSSLTVVSLYRRAA
jgi:uncharacterized protein YndB with AHSA1/START domain